MATLSNPALFALFFGGLTVLELDIISNTYVRDDAAPFTNPCSLVVRDSNGVGATRRWSRVREVGQCGFQSREA